MTCLEAVCLHTSDNARCLQPPSTYLRGRLLALLLLQLLCGSLILLLVLLLLLAVAVHLQQHCPCQQPLNSSVMPQWKIARAHQWASRLT